MRLKPLSRGLIGTVATGALALSLAACGGDGGGGGGGGGASVSPPPPTTSSPGSGLFAIDCNKQRAYVPLQTFDKNGNGQVAVVDLTADPDNTNPITKVVSLSHSDRPTGTAYDNDDNLILVVSGKQSGQDGKLDIIDESGNNVVAGSPFAFPAGSQSGFFGQILYNPVSKQAIASTCSSSSCGGLGDATTGFVTFGPKSHNFGSIVPASYPETFALNAVTNTIVDSSDDKSSSLDIVDMAAGRACDLKDDNTIGDHDGASTDASTNITVISNENGTATIINLNGSTTDVAPPTTPCNIVEGGTTPNSVLLSGLPDSTAGSAVDATRHQAFLIEDGSNGISLIQLPSAALTQLTSSDIPAPVTSTIPNDPDGSFWSTQGDPYAVALDVCKNRGYAIDGSFKYLVGIDLTTMKNTPDDIKTPLPAGNCKGTSSTFSCKNGKGVTFFPLPS